METLYLIDTPGWLDTKDRTIEQTNEMVKALKAQAKYVTTFLLILKADSKMTPTLQTMISGM